jgi:hypothetical protein
MDKKQLVTIAVTTVVSVIAREVIAWLVALVKSTATRETTREKLRKAITKRRLLIVADTFGLLYGIWLFVRILLDKTPINRLEIAFISAYTVNLIYWTARLFLDSADAILKWYEQRSEGPPPT